MTARPFLAAAAAAGLLALAWRGRPCRARRVLPGRVSEYPTGHVARRARVRLVRAGALPIPTVAEIERLLDGPDGAA